MFQLRIYTINNNENADIYLDKHWKRHLVSLPKYGITVHNVYKEVGASGECRIFALVSSDGDLAAQNEEYMKSTDFTEDMAGFDMSAIKGVQEIALDKKY
jgi:hypothetical protein